MANKDVSFKIKAKDEATGSIKKIAGSINTLTNTAQSKTQGLTDLSKSLISLGTAVPIVGLLAASVSKFTVTLKESEIAFSKLELSEKLIDFSSKINTALGETSTSLKNFAGNLSSELENTVAAGDIQKAITQLSFDKTATEIKKLIPVATDLSAALGVSLDTAVKQLSATLGGEAGELANYFPKLKELTVEQKKVGAAIDYVGQKVKGAAKEMATSTLGSMTRYKNSMSDLSEELGGLITDGITPMRDAISSLTKGWADALAAIREYKNAHNAVISGNADSFQSKIIMDKTEENYSKDTFSFGSSGKEIVAQFSDIIYAFNSKRGKYEGSLSRSELKDFRDSLIAQPKMYKKLQGIASEYLHAQEQLKGAKIAEAEASKKAKKEAELQRKKEKTAAEAKQKAEFELARKIQSVKNKIANGTLSSQEGSRQLSLLSDRKFKDALTIRSSEDSSPELKQIAQNFINAFMSGLDISDENYKSLKSKEKKEKDGKYIQTLENAIIKGLSPATAALEQLKTNNLFVTLKGTPFAELTEIERTALESLLKQEKQLEDNLKKEKSQGSAKETAENAFKSTELGGMILGDPITTIINSVVKAAMSIESVSKLLNPLTTLLDGVVSVLGPVLNTILSPLVGFITILGEQLGQLLIPMFIALEPVFQMFYSLLAEVLNIINPFIPIAGTMLAISVKLATAFLPFTTLLVAFAQTLSWLINTIFIPIGKFVATVVDTISNFFIDGMNAIIDALNHIPFVSIGRLAKSNIAGSLNTSTIDTKTLSKKGGSGSSSRSNSGAGIGANYNAERDVTVNITINADAVAGEGGIRELALMIQHALKNAGELGLT